jgi:hypothetical protein
MDAITARQDLAPLGRWERRSLYLVLLLLIAFGVIVEIRCVFMPNRQTDLGVYLRAAWAARAGVNPYGVTDDNGWHFCYPPVISLLFMPLADAPPGADRTWMLPWAVSVVIWYLFSLACLFLAAHWLALTLEAGSRDPALRNLPVGCRRWWFLRMFPVTICFVQIGSTLARGQVSLIIILCTAGALAALQHGRRVRSGLWLAAAACLKVIPAFLLLFPLWRRQWRTLAGAALGLAGSLVILPALYWGIPQALELNQQMIEAVLHPGLGRGGDQARADELTNVTATDNQSIQATLHNYQYWSRLEARPNQPASWTRWAHWLLGGALTLAVLGAAGWRGTEDSIQRLLFLGSLLLIMTLVTPVSHLHYFSMALPLVMGILAAALERRPGYLFPGWSTLSLLFLAGIGYALPSIPLWQKRREAGLPLIVSVLLLATATWLLWRRRHLSEATTAGQVSRRQAA